MALETRIYQKENQLRLGHMFRASFKDLISSRFLAKQLAVRDIKAQYRQSYLGILWAFITPLFTAFVWVFLSRSGTVTLTDTGAPYPVFAFTGTLIWSIITESINAPTASTKSAKGIMSKINFPKEALILSGVYKLLFNTGIKCILLLFFIFFYGVGFHATQLLFPLAILVAILFGTTIGLFLTPIGMLYSDVGKIISVGLSFLMYVTPVVYVIPKTGIMKTIMEINPLTPLILTARDLILGNTPAFFNYFIGIFVGSLLLFSVALVFYRISIPILVERSNA
ncbi:ABC transporter permease [Tamlana sp. 2_MG-2023]|uniref:ABC transporter permease n=1 Tax=unclassified Tamlana TaxID=2614803 RepID=UPI0026E36187|nr:MULTISPECIES: ABC transporter permease [unclassified Tamlana]MDO6758735.1 ABC transporter permease [Tamlana sp. 2_MG-2023]MDO6789434.1 ABC transporter permease [Tamlana sp. 1_MG-2023]